MTSDRHRARGRHRLFHLLLASLGLAAIGPAMASAPHSPSCDNTPAADDAPRSEAQPASAMSVETARVRPQSGLIRTASGATPVLIHTVHAAAHVAAVTSSAVQIIEVSSGAILAQFSHPDFVDAVVAEVTAVDTQGDGYTDRILFGDSGGTLWRADIDPAASRRWSAAQPAHDQGLTPLARFGRHGRDGHHRLIDQAPDLVPGRDGHGDFDAIIVSARETTSSNSDGSGQAWLLMIKDRRTGIIAAQTDAPVLHLEDLARVDPECPDVERCIAESAATLAQGWALTLASAGEQVLDTPISLNGVVHVTSLLSPQRGPSACRSGEQTLRRYAIDLMTGYSRARRDDPEAPAFIDIETAGRPLASLLPTPDRLLAADPRLNETRPGIWLRTYWQFEEASID